MKQAEMDFYAWADRKKAEMPNTTFSINPGDTLEILKLHAGRLVTCLVLDKYYHKQPSALNARKIGSLRRRIMLILYSEPYLFESLYIIVRDLYGDLASDTDWLTLPKECPWTVEQIMEMPIT